MFIHRFISASVLAASLIGCGIPPTPVAASQPPLTPIPVEPAPPTAPTPPPAPPARTGPTWFLSTSNIIKGCAVTSAQAVLDDPNSEASTITAMFTAIPDTVRVVILLDGTGYPAQYSTIVADIRSRGADVVEGLPWDQTGPDSFSAWVQRTYPTTYWASTVHGPFSAPITLQQCAELNASWTAYSKAHNL